jgi:hypothetical protein
LSILAVARCLQERDAQRAATAATQVEFEQVDYRLEQLEAIAAAETRYGTTCHAHGTELTNGSR